MEQKMAVQLLARAYEARKQSYSPYSGFSVGAALLTASGSCITGCNIENASFGATNCAERTAIFRAVSEGERQFAAIAVAGGQKDVWEPLCLPCGICLQVMAEFCDPDNFEIILGLPGEPKTFLLRELLPSAFVLKKEESSKDGCD